MKALTQAIYAKCGSGTSLYSAIGGRLYDTRAPDSPTYPYVVYLVVSDLSDPTFTEQLEDLLIQFSIFSADTSSGQVKDIFTALKALYDDCDLSVTGETFLYMRRQGANLTIEDHTTPSGTMRVWHLPVDYAVMTKVAA